MTAPRGLDWAPPAQAVLRRKAARRSWWVRGPMAFWVTWREIVGPVSHRDALVAGACAAVAVAAWFAICWGR